MRSVVKELKMSANRDGAITVTIGGDNIYTSHSYNVQTYLVYVDYMYTSITFLYNHKRSDRKKQADLHDPHIFNIS